MDKIHVVGSFETGFLDWLDVDVDTSDLKNAFESSDFVISTRELEKANKKSVETNTPFLGIEKDEEEESISSVTGSGAVVGPLVTSESACRKCLEMRVSSKESKSGNEDGDEKMVPDVAYTGIADGYGALETSRFVQSEAETVGSVALFGKNGETLGLHNVSKAPYCPVCWSGSRDRDIEMEKSVEESPLDESLDKAELLLDSVTGILRDVSELPADDTRVPYYLVEIGDAPFSDASPPDYSGGVSIEWQEAMMKAFGEGLERYSASIYRHEEFMNKPYSDISNIAVDPQRLALFGDEQYDEIGYEKPDPEKETEWVEGVSFTRDTGVLIPAEFVHFPYDSEFAPDITTGLSLHSTVADAVEGGLLEVVERDACMKVWLEDIVPDKLGLEYESLSADTRELVSRVGSAGIEVHASHLDNGMGIPVVGVALVQEDYPKFAISASASLDPEEAFKGALEETIQSRREISQMERKEMGKEEVSTTEEHVVYSADLPETVERFVGEPEKKLSEIGRDVSDDPVERFETIRESVEDAGFEVIGADVTPPDIEEADFNAVRVLVPEAQPLHFGMKMRRKGGRLDIKNEEPHPFP